MPPPTTLPRLPERRAARLESIDLLRGGVMILMALDHTRGFFSNAPFSPVDLTRTFPALFATRWITYFCAPSFFLLAGISAFLHGARGRTRGQLAWYLCARGLWLVWLELTYLNWFAWSGIFSAHDFLAVVFWALGWSMVLLAGLIWLPGWLIGAIGAALCLGHNLFDNVAPESWGAWAWLWRVLHAGGRVELPWNSHLDVMYRVIPWAGVMALGYTGGPVFLMDAATRRKWVARAGAALAVGFVLIRLCNGYGDPSRWSPQKNAVFTVMSFVNCTKYPPSLDFLLMTLGPILLALAALEGETPRWLRPALVFGQVPMFFFLLHLPLIRVAASATHSVRPPPRTGFGLLGVYVTWVIIMLLLYYPCRRFAEFKRRNKSAWLSYF